MLQGPPEQAPPDWMVELVGPLPLPITDDVAITNSEPLNVQIVPAREPVQVDFNLICNAPRRSCSSAIYTVPAGKRLTIEFFSMEISNITDPDKVAPFVTTTLGGEAVGHQLGLYTEMSVAGSEPGFHFNISENVKLYADQNTDVFVGFDRERGETKFFYKVYAGISGYLEAVP